MWQQCGVGSAAAVAVAAAAVAAVTADAQADLMPLAAPWQPAVLPCRHMDGPAHGLGGLHDDAGMQADSLSDLSEVCAPCFHVSPHLRLFVPAHKPARRGGKLSGASSCTSSCGGTLKLLA